LQIADCRLPIGELAIEDCRLGLKIGDWIGDCRLKIGVAVASGGNAIVNAIDNPHSTLNRHSAIRESAIESAIANRQSVNRQSAVCNRQ
jgi:hypothetical protein